MNLYQQYIAKSKYARYLDDKNRREHWPETVKRYFDFMAQHLSDMYSYDLIGEERKELEDAVLNLEVMPSMRLMMTAGDACIRQNLTAYNCSFIAIDDVKAFDEAMYILMCGTGVGFSVERQFVNKLPEIPDTLFKSDTTIVVKDSKEGWAKALRQLIALLYSGEIPKWDMSKVRKAGARLRTFGGRSSGPDVLGELFRFVITVFKGAEGRKLNSLECHDIMCKIGEIVVVGGVRRSALISLSNLSDERMRKAKSGEWWTKDPQRSLANNSAVYTEKPDIGIFMQEWLSLYESKSGERGIFNRQAADLNAKRTGRRKEYPEGFGTNPSLAYGTKVWTENGIKEIQNLEGSNFEVTNLNGDIASAYCWLSGTNEELVEIKLEGGLSYKATPKHKWPVLQPDGSWKSTFTSDLKIGDKFKNIKRSSLYPKGTEGSFIEGFILGWNIGDGWLTNLANDKFQVGFIVEEADRVHGIHVIITDYLQSLGIKTSLLDKKEINISNKSIRDVFNKYGVKHKSLGIATKLWDSDISEEFRKGYIDGLFSSDGSVEQTGRITLVSSHLQLLKDVSELLGFYGIKSNIISQYKTKTNFGIFDRHTLRISGAENVQHFSNIFKLTNKCKQGAIDAYLSKVLRYKGNDNSSTRKVVGLIPLAEKEPVWDVTVYDETHAFQLSQCITGNCGEITLRNCGLCNLTEAVIRAEDSWEDIQRKVKLATIIGTFQSTLTYFPYVRKIWQKNAEEERLLGVSLTGIMDNKLTQEGSEELLGKLKNFAIDVNKMLSEKLGINPSASITCVKPSGTVSQLVNCSSGIHGAHSPYYIRRVRGDNKDPLTKFLIEKGVPSEPCVMRPESTTVFSFPIKASEHSKLRTEMSAIEQLEIWLKYKKYWTEHNPSVTVTVKEHEWMTVGAWVYENFDEVQGVSFLPYDGHTYKQAPYEEIDEATYLRLCAELPEEINWDDLVEKEDNVEGAQNLACQGGFCEL